jgi:hypothetical protein
MHLFAFPDIRQGMTDRVSVLNHIFSFSDGSNSIFVAVFQVYPYIVRRIDFEIVAHIIKLFVAQEMPDSIIE